MLLFKLDAHKLISRSEITTVYSHQPACYLHQYVLHRHRSRSLRKLAWNIWIGMYLRHGRRDHDHHSRNESCLRHRHILPFQRVWGRLVDWLPGELALVLWLGGSYRL